MRNQYITVQEGDFSFGIDTHSAENQIPEGFVRDLLNADIVGKRARKRPGLQGYAGDLPIRVVQMQYVNGSDQVQFTLDSAVSLESVISLELLRSSPLVVYGRSGVFGSGDGPFIGSEDRVRYFPSFSIPTRKGFVAPSGTLTIPGDEHGLGTTNLFQNVVASTNVASRSHTQIGTNGTTVNESSFDVNIDYVVAQDTPVFAYFADKDTVSGQTYVHTEAGIAVGTTTFSIPASTHNLSNLNIISQMQSDDGAVRRYVEADNFSIAANGDISVTVTNATAGTIDLVVILSAAPISNSATGVIAASSTGTVVISDLESPWIFPGIYLDGAGGTRELVLPNTMDYDDATRTYTLTFNNVAPVARAFTVFYEFGDLRSNQLTVQSSEVTVTGVDDRPQITIWGLDQSDIYIDKFNREAWVNHVDSYRRPAEQRLVAGLGGNLFSARDYAEVATDYMLPLLHPYLNSRSTGSSQVLAPLVWDTGNTPGRSRGYITADDGGSHWLRATAVGYDSTNGWTKYTVPVPSKAILDSTGTPTTLSAVISTTSGMEDFLTVQDMSYARHNGTFRIRQVQDGTNQITIWVENDQVDSTDWDDTGTGGEVGVFTDLIMWAAASPYVPGDFLISEVFGDSFLCNVVASSGSQSMLSGVTDTIGVPASVLFVGQRTSDVIPMRVAYPEGTPSVLGVVRGDMLSYVDGTDTEQSLAQMLRVLYINPDQNRTVSIDGDGETATVTLGSGITTFLTPGRKVVLVGAGVYSGVQTVADVLSSNEFTFLSAETETAVAGTLQGGTVQVDEEFSWTDRAEDSSFLTCEQRWIPIEAPDDAFDQTPSTYIRHFDARPYSNQPLLKSTTVVDNMYFTDYDDAVMKFDGQSVYRAGLLDWQPAMFITQETTGATIVTDLRSIPTTAIDAPLGRLTIAFADAASIPDGTPIRLSGSTQTYTVREYTDDGTDAYLFVDRSLDANVTTGSAAEIGTWRYYVRLNAVDANDNLIASAITSSQDLVVELTGNAAVQFKLVGMPVWDNYDYKRIEAQIYRTTKNQVAPFYLVTTLPVSFNNGEGYIQYRDSFADTDLTNLDPVNTALKGAELGTSFSQPLRARTLTSLGNRLVLGNVRDYPQLDIQIVAPASLTNADMDGDSLLFRRRDTDAGVVTEMNSTAKYEWVDGFTGTPTDISTGTDEFTVEGIAEPVVAGDWIYLTYATVAATARDLTYSGWYQINSVTGAGPYDATISNPGGVAPATVPNRYVLATDPTNIPVLLGVDGNLGMVNGDSFDLFDAMRRASLAINASMRMVDTSIPGFEDFTPWLIARGGNDLTPAGRLIVRQPRASTDTFELVPTFGTEYTMFVNERRVLTASQTSAVEKVFPSRVLVSYENYPEVYDAPTVILDGDSDSAIDINSADGQEVTVIRPFFGEAAFGASQQAATLVVFKSNSIYLVDVNEKAAGRNPVQRIESEGLGCTFPNSVAVTHKGIMFANESGMYCLRRDLTIQYLGKYMERNWTERVDLDRLDLAIGHHYSFGRSYKLSVPLVGTETSTGYIEPSEAYVYNHTNEDEIGRGAWSRYSNHPVVGWANLAPDAYLATTKGRVLSVRNTGEASDYRDDMVGIEFRLQTRPNDFGDGAIRKAFDKIVVHYRALKQSLATFLNFSLDLEEEYTETSSIRLGKEKVGSGVDDHVDKSITTVASSLGRARGTYLSVEISNSEKDQSIEVAGIGYRIAGLSTSGIRQAGEPE